MPSVDAELRGPFSGVAQILRFNWPWYVGGLLASGLALCAITTIEMPGAVAALAGLGAAAALFWTIGSIVGSYWVYDRADVLGLRWLREILCPRPGRWVNVHAGLDQTTDRLLQLFPPREYRVLDLYDPELMPEPSIARARALQPARGDTERVRPGRLPLPDGETETVFLIFAAHELRAAGDRRELFRELRRSSRVGGRLVLVEHYRDLANFVAFGPGFRHFFSRREWWAAAEEADWEIERSMRVTPLVGVTVFRR